MDSSQIGSFGPGIPQLAVKLTREGDQLALTVTQKQEDRFDFRLGLEIVEGDERRSVSLRIDDAVRTYVLPASAGAHVRVDPGYRVLAEVSLEGPDTWLCTLLSDEDPVLVKRAAKALLARDSRRGRAAVLEALGTHPHWAVRASIARLLGSHGSQAVCTRLVERLAEESEPRARRGVVDALGRLRGYPEAVDALVAVLQEPEFPTWQLEAAAVVALAKTRDPPSVRADPPPASQFGVGAIGSSIARSKRSGTCAMLRWFQI